MSACMTCVLASAQERLFNQGSAVVPAETPVTNRSALLVGCTKYDNLPPGRQLSGPINDVNRFRDLLIRRYSYQSQDIRTLTEKAGHENRPTAANIFREFERLIASAKPGQQVFILLAGHGSQQPVDPKDDDPQNFEPDGLDETFLPADVTPASKGTPISNVIIDNQIRRWCDAIQSKGASLIVVVDACHSGGMVRGQHGETMRKVPAEELTPPDMIEHARLSADEHLRAIEKTNPTAVVDFDRRTPFNLPPNSPNLVAIYATQATEPEVELDLPQSAKDAKCHGLLTFTLAKILEQSTKPLTYMELVQRVRTEYSGLGRLFPTPLIEGGGRDRFVFSDENESNRPPLTLSRDREGNWQVDAGRVGGLTPGSILEIYPSAGSNTDSQIVGYAKVANYGLESLSACIEPCEFNEMRPPQGLVKGMRARIVQIEFGLNRAKLAIDPVIGDDDSSTGSTPQRMDSNRLVSLTAKLSKLNDKSKLFMFSEEPKGADWLVRQLKTTSDELFLVPSDGLAISDKEKLAASFGPIPLDSFEAWIVNSLTRIQKVRNLLSVSSAASDMAASSTNSQLQVEILKLKDKADDRGEPLFNPIVYAGDILGVKMTNRGNTPIDVTVLYVASDYSIQVFFPRSVGVDNVLPASVNNATGRPLTLRFQVDEVTLGTEQLIVLGVIRTAGTLPIDFAFIAQEGVERARPTSLTRGGSAIDTPFGILLANAAFSPAETRGLRVSVQDGFIVSRALQVSSRRGHPSQ